MEDGGGVFPAWIKDAKRRVGRPSLYDHSMCERLIEFAAEGCTVVEMAARLGIRKSTLYEWAKDQSKPEFSDALACAREISEALHAERYRLGCCLPAAAFNAQAYAKFMGIVFADWREVTRTEHTGADGGPIETKEVSERDIAQRAAFLLQRGLMSGPPTKPH